MSSLLLALGDDPESDDSAYVYTMPSGAVAFNLPDGWDGAWFRSTEAARLRDWLITNVEAD